MIVKLCGITSVEDARAAQESGADWIGLNMVAGPRRISLDVVREIVTRLSDPSRAVVLLSFNGEGTRNNQSRDREGASCARDVESRSRVMPDELLSLGVRRLQLYGSVTPADLVRLRDCGFETILVQHIHDGRALTALDAMLRRCAELWDNQIPGSAGASPSHSVRSQEGVRDERAAAPPDYLLFDAADAKQLGGTGRLANWGAVVQGRNEDRRAAWPLFLLAGGLNPENVADAIRTVRPFGVDVSSGVESSPGCKDAEKMRRFVVEARAAFAKVAGG